METQDKNNNLEQSNNLHVLMEVQEALETEKNLEQNQRKKQQEEQDKEVGRISMLPKILRIVGAIVLLSSALTFMAQGWETMSHMIRYFTFLGFTGLLAVLGFFCGLKVKEDKGARTFLGVAAAIIPAHFCQLGGLIYSKFGPAINPDLYPSYFYWVAASGFDALVTTGIALLALTPITFIAFSALARREALRLTGAYIALNALLLIPTRDPSISGLIASLAILGVAYLDTTCFKQDTAMKTKEGRISRLILLVPGALLFLRIAFLYGIDGIFVGAALATSSLALFVFSKKYCSLETAKVLQSCSILPTILSWLVIAFELKWLIDLPDAFMLPLVTIPLAAIFIAKSLSCLGGRIQYQRLAALALVGGAFLELVMFPGLNASIFSIAVGILAIAYGYTAESKFVFLGGLFTFGHGLIDTVKLALTVITISPWIALAIIGGLTVLGSSYLEVHTRRIVKQIGLFRKKMSTWS